MNRKEHILKKARTVGTPERLVLKKCYLPDGVRSHGGGMTEEREYYICEMLYKAGLLGRRLASTSAFFFVLKPGKDILLENKPALFDWRDFPDG